MVGKTERESTENEESRDSREIKGAHGMTEVVVGHGNANREGGECFSKKKKRKERDLLSVKIVTM